MGLVSPERLEQVKQIKPGQLLSQKSKIFLIRATTTNKSRDKNNCKPVTTEPERAKSRTLYKLSKININSSFNNLCRDIFRYGVS